MKGLVFMAEMAKSRRYGYRARLGVVALMGSIVVGQSPASAQAAPSVTLAPDPSGQQCQRRVEITPESKHGYQVLLRQRLNGRQTDQRFEMGRGTPDQTAAANRTPTLVSGATYELWVRSCLSTACEKRSAWSEVVRFPGPNIASCVAPQVPTVTLEPASTADGCTRRISLSPPSQQGYQISLVQRLPNGGIVKMGLQSDRATSATNNRTPPLQNGARYQVWARSCADSDCAAASDWSTRVDFLGPTDLACVARPPPPVLTVKREGCQIVATASASSEAGATPKAIKIEIRRKDALSGATNNTLLEDKLSPIDANTANPSPAQASFTLTRAGDYTVTAVACIDERCEQRSQSSNVSTQNLLVNLAIGECQQQARSRSNGRQLAVVRSMCTTSTTGNAPQGDAACSGAFSARPIDLSYLLPDSPLTLHLGDFALRYSSGSVGDNYHGVGEGWFLSPIGIVIRQDDASREAWHVENSGEKRRLVRQEDGTYRTEGAPHEWRYSFTEQDEVIALNQTEDVARVYRATAPNVFQLVEIRVKRPGLSEATIKLASTRRSNGQAGSGSIVFSEGNHSIRWVYDPKINGLRFSSGAGNQFATLSLSREGRLISARLSSDGVVSKTSDKLIDMTFTYNAKNLLANYTSTVAGVAQRVFVFYDSFNMVRAVNQQGFTTNYSRLRYSDGTTVLTVSRPNRITSQYTYSADKLLVAQRSFVAQDGEDARKHFGVANFTYESPSQLGGLRRLSTVDTQGSGELVRFIYTYDEDHPTYVRVIEQQRASGTTERRTDYTWNQRGQLDGMKVAMFKHDGTASEIVSGYSIDARETAAPFRPLVVKDLVSNQSAAFAYAGSDTTVQMSDRNGTRIKSIRLDSRSGFERLVSLEDHLGLSPRVEWQYNEADRVTAQRSSYGESVENSYNAQGQLTHSTAIDELGVRTVTSLDPASGRVTALRKVYPTGVIENTDISYLLWPGGSVKSITKSTSYVTGAGAVEVFEFNEAGTLVAIVRDGVRKEVG
ncbi:MAG: hypothetical protein RIS36_1605 [Pseudomonadota bacterium]